MNHLKKSILNLSVISHAVFIVSWPPKFTNTGIGPGCILRKSHSNIIKSFFICKQNSASAKTTPAKVDHEELSDYDANESSASKPFVPVSKTYARKRLSMTARLVSANTASAQPSKKPRSK